MKTYIQILIILFVLILIWNSLVLEILGAKLLPNIALAFSFLFLLNGNLEKALYSGFVSGILLDLLNQSHLGLNSLIFCVILLISYYLVKQITQLKTLFYFFALIGHLLFFSIGNQESIFDLQIFIGAISTVLLLFLFQHIFNFFVEKTGYEL